MTGTILGYDTSSKTGTILAQNGTRYHFTNQDWKENTFPTKAIKVDFVADDENNAKEIYSIKDQSEEDTNSLLGFVAVAITFFFGFIGTFVSRLFIAKESLSSVIIPTVLHFIISAMLIIPLFGWIIYAIGTCYYMYTNYIHVTEPEYNPYT